MAIVLDDSQYAESIRTTPITSAHSLPVDEKITHRELCKTAQPDLYRHLSAMNESAPVGSLPADVVILIFEAANEMPRSEYDPWIHRKEHLKPFPLIASQVSQFWRDVAIHSPLLWTLVDISPPWSLGLTRLFLKRSRRCPIDLRLQIPSVYFSTLLSPEDVSATVGLLSEAIEPHISRCRSISICGDFECTGTMLFTLLNVVCKSKVPLLQSFTLGATGVFEYESGESVRGLPIFPHGAPVLQNIRLVGPRLYSWRPPLAQITTLHLGAGGMTDSDMSFAEFASMMTCCPLLHTLVIYDDLFVRVWPDNVSLELPSLRSLQMYGTITTVSDILLATSAPRLEDLVIAPVVVDDLAGFHSWQSSLFTVKFPTVKSLTLSPASVNSFQVLRLASVCFPAVDELTMPNIHGASFSAVFTDPTELLWPKLSTLALRDIGATNEDSLLAVISHRESIGYPLKKLCLDAASLTRITHTLSQLEGTLDILEQDSWFIRRHDDPLYDQAHFVGNDFDFETMG